MVIERALDTKDDQLPDQKEIRIMNLALFFTQKGNKHAEATHLVVKVKEYYYRRIYFASKSIFESQDQA